MEDELHDITNEEWLWTLEYQINNTEAAIYMNITWLIYCRYYQ